MSRASLTAAAIALTLVTTTTGPASADEAASNQLDTVGSLDDRWVPWLGCWQLWEEQFEAGAAPLDDDAAALVDRTYVCVTPSDDGSGIELTAAAGNEVLVERTMTADARRREVHEPGCEGWEESAWSADGRRLFTRASLRCEDQPPRTVDGVSLLTSPSTWVDIQIVEAGQRAQVEVRRYSPVSATEAAALQASSATLPVEPEAIRQARRESAQPLTIAGVIEASERAPTRVVEMLLVETEPRLALDSQTLIALDDAGITDGVIDLLVALSYPERFVVERRDRGGSWSSGSFGAFGGRSSYYDPIWYGDLYPYYITPFGYSGWGPVYGPAVIGGAASPFLILDTNAPDGAGKAVQGRGYTRVRPRELDDTRRARPRGRSSGSGTTESSGRGATTSSGSGASSGGTTTSSGGYSRGGSSSGSSGGRKAVPRK